MDTVALLREQLQGEHDPLNDVRRAAVPRATLLDFLQTTYTVGADLADLDRASLERPLN